jgi:hypothetical protein
MINTQILSTLSQKIQNGTASKAEKDNYMWILYQNGHITKKQYDEYADENNSSEVLNAGLTIGAIVLLGSLIRKIAAS